MKIDVAGARARAGSRYPKPFDEPCRNKTRRRLGLAVGLTQFGVNLLELGPGAWSSQRHWHAREDEFVYIVRGRVVLVTERWRNRAQHRRLRRLQGRGVQWSSFAEPR